MTTWPSSAPAPLRPRNALPPEITPPPTPVPSVSMTTSSSPRPAPALHSPIAAALASLSSPTGMPKRSCIRSRSGAFSSGRLTQRTTTPCSWSIGDGTPKPTAPTESSISSATAASSSARTCSCESCGVGRSRRRTTLPSVATTPARIFVPPRSTPIACPACTVGTVNPRMAASGEKPYRVYKGGRAKGRVPLERKQRERDERRAVRRSGGPGPGRIVERRRRLWLGWTWRRWTLVAILGLIVLFAVWGVAGYLSVSSGVSDANARLPQNVPPVLTSDNGLIFSTPTTILLLGTDHATGKGGQGRSADQHSDSITLLHTDPGRH